MYGAIQGPGKPERVILGIDPGFTVSGFGVVKSSGGRTSLLDYGALRMSSADSLVNRVGQFHTFFDQKIRLHHVTDVALETSFLGKNAQNFLKLGYLRGILYLLAHTHHLSVYEFAPREIKLALTGFGGAEKEQVARIVLRLFPTLQMPGKLDVTDALAITLCGLWRGGALSNY